MCTRTFVGSLALGWGLFNLVEGIIDHHVLGVHHVVETPGHLRWDITFLASGVILIRLGGLIQRLARDGTTLRRQPSAT